MVNRSLADTPYKSANSYLPFQASEYGILAALRTFFFTGPVENGPMMAEKCGCYTAKSNGRSEGCPSAQAEGLGTLGVFRRRAWVSAPMEKEAT